MDKANINENTLPSQTECCRCRTKKTARSNDLQRILQNRLNRMIGQLNGIKNMIDQNRYCGDILNQVSAVENALQGFGYIVLQNHMESCVADEIKQGNLQILDEALELIKKLK